jgi:hypothetical protein
LAIKNVIWSQASLLNDVTYSKASNGFYLKIAMFRLPGHTIPAYVWRDCPHYPLCALNQSDKKARPCARRRGNRELTQASWPILLKFSHL